MSVSKKFLLYGIIKSNPQTCRDERRSPKMPMSAAELKNLDKNIVRLKEQLANKRDTFVIIAPEEKVRLKQQIDDLREQIRDLEREQWQLISQMTGDLTITDEEAELDTENTFRTYFPTFNRYLRGVKERLKK